MRDIGAQNSLGRAYVQKGMMPQAVVEFRKAEELGVRRAHWAASMAELYVKSGRRPEAEKMLAAWSRRPSQEFGHAESMAMIYAGLGKKDEAFKWLDQAYREHWDRLPWIKIEPEYENLQDDPRFFCLAPIKWDWTHAEPSLVSVTLIIVSFWLQIAAMFA